MRDKTPFQQIFVEPSRQVQLELRPVGVHNVYETFYYGGNFPWENSPVTDINTSLKS